MIIEAGKRLYHGSYVIVDKPDLAKCEVGKDFGKVGSDVADRTAIALLMPEKLTDQICIRTETALHSLGFVGSETVDFKR